MGALFCCLCRLLFRQQIQPSTFTSHYKDTKSNNTTPYFFSSCSYHTQGSIDVNRVYPVQYDCCIRKTSNNSFPPARLFSVVTRGGERKKERTSLQLVTRGVHNKQISGEFQTSSVLGNCFRTLICASSLFWVQKNAATRTHNVAVMFASLNLRGSSWHGNRSSSNC